MITKFIAVLSFLLPFTVAQARLTDRDLNDCNVLTGQKKAAEFSAYLSSLKSAVEQGSEDDTGHGYF